MIEQHRGVLLIKSGFDFNELNEIKITPSEEILDPAIFAKKKKDVKESESLEKHDPQAYVPQVIHDKNCAPDTPYEYKALNLNDKAHKSYRIKICKRDITLDV